MDQFHVLKKLGSGYASSVYLGTCRQTGLQVSPQRAYTAFSVPQEPSRA